MGKALYRKYRPTALQDVVGQDAVIKPLQNVLKSGNFSHAYLFAGPRGCGKTSVARIFAHAVNQFSYQLEDSYVDIIEIDAASNTGVENIRELREKAIIAPTAGQYKVYIIDEVHMLSRSAFNALLKILEEPPAHVIFIMATTDPEKVPITVRSRAQIFAFSLASPEVMFGHLKSIATKEKIKITDGALELIVHRGGGSFRDTISLLDQLSTISDKTLTPDMITAALGLPSEELSKDLLSAYRTSDAATIFNALKTALNATTKPELIAEALIRLILADPAPELLPLLKTLPEVSAPFASAKLTVALLENCAPKSPQPTPPVPAAPKSPQPATPPPPAPKTAQKVDTDGSASVPEPAAGFSWDTFCSQVSASSAIGGYLAHCDHDLTGTTLHLYPDKGFIKKVFESGNNPKTIRASLPSGYDFIVHDVGSNHTTNFDTNQPSPYSQLSDIMGGTVQEVKDGGANPFA